MKFTASRETEVGFELESVTKKMTLDKTRIWCGWPRVKNWHDDYVAAQKAGFPKPLIMGAQNAQHMEGLLHKFFGEGYLGGRLSTTFIKPVFVDDEITFKGIVTEKVAEGNAIRLLLDVWCDNQRGEKVIIGTASGLVH